MVGADRRLVHAGDQGRATRRADRRGHERLGEPRPLAASRSTFGVCDRLLAVAREVRRHVVDDDPDDVRLQLVRAEPAVPRTQTAAARTASPIEISHQVSSIDRPQPREPFNAARSSARILVPRDGVSKRLVSWSHSGVVLQRETRLGRGRDGPNSLLPSRADDPTLTQRPRNTSPTRKRGDRVGNFAAFVATYVCRPLCLRVGLVSNMPASLTVVASTIRLGPSASREKGCPRQPVLIVLCNRIAWPS